MKDISGRSAAALLVGVFCTPAFAQQRQRMPNDNTIQVEQQACEGTFMPYAGRRSRTRTASSIVCGGNMEQARP